jgi:hypothetical protein
MKHKKYVVNQRLQHVELHLAIDSEGRLKTILYDKRDDLNFLIVNFPFICNNNPKHNKYVVNQKREHVDDISFKEIFGRIRVDFFAK